MKKALMLFCLITISCFAISPGDLVVNEICFNSEGDDEEWVELYNTSSSTITLDSTFTLSDGEGTYTFEGATVDPDTFLTIMVLTSGAFPFTAHVDATPGGLALGNSNNDQVILREGETIIDSVEYDPDWMEENRPLERINPNYSGLNPANWMSSRWNLGTPGRTNSEFDATIDLPPAVLRIWHEPNLPSSDDDVVIYAYIIDEEGVDEAQVYFTSDTVFHRNTMMTFGDDLFESPTAPYTHGDLVNYFVIAEDDAGQIDTSIIKSYFINDSMGFAEGPLAITEIMYDSPDADTEWVELYNRRDYSIDLSGWTLKDGSRSDFEFPEGVVLGAHEYIVVCADSAEFEARYDIDNYIGNSPFQLNNGGDSLILKDSSGRIIDMLEYGTGGGWPSEAHGGGYTLMLIDPDSDNSNPDNWVASSDMWGTPGEHNEAISEKFAEHLPENISITDISPNPFNSSCNVEFSVNSNEKVSVEMIDTYGRVLLTEDINTKSGVNQMTINADNMPSGVYLISINGKSKACRKAILIK